jgi:hypothetical protein
MMSPTASPSVARATSINWNPDAHLSVRVPKRPAQKPRRFFQRYGIYKFRKHLSLNGAISGLEKSERRIVWIVNRQIVNRVNRSDRESCESF